MRPDYWRLFFSSPVKWYYAVTAAHNNCQFLLNEDKHHAEIFRRYRRYHGGNLRVSLHIYALIVNLFPRVFGTRYGLFTALHRTALVGGAWLLAVLLSPVLLYRVAFPAEKRWRRRKRRMMDDGTADKMLRKVVEEHGN